MMKREGAWRKLRPRDDVVVWWVSGRLQRPKAVSADCGLIEMIVPAQMSCVRSCWKVGVTVYSPSCLAVWVALRRWLQVGYAGDADLKFQKYHQLKSQITRKSAWNGVISGE